MGPLLAAFITETQRWPLPFWVFFAMNVLGLALVVSFLQETYYDRSIPAEEQPAQGHRIARLIGISQWKSRHLRNTFTQACWRTVSVLLKPTVAIACLFYALVRHPQVRHRTVHQKLATRKLTEFWSRLLHGPSVLIPHSRYS